MSTVNHYNWLQVPWASSWEVANNETLVPPKSDEQLSIFSFGYHMPCGRLSSLCQRWHRELQLFERDACACHVLSSTVKKDSWRNKRSHTRCLQEAESHKRLTQLRGIESSPRVAPGLRLARGGALVDAAIQLPCQLCPQKVRGPKQGEYFQKVAEFADSNKDTGFVPS